MNTVKNPDCDNRIPGGVFQFQRLFPSEDPKIATPFILSSDNNNNFKGDPTSPRDIMVISSSVEPLQVSPTATAKSSLTLWVAVLCALGNALSVGLVVGFPSAALDSLKDHTKEAAWTKDKESWIASIMTIGAMGGSIAAAPLLSLLGPKNATVLVNVPFAVGWIFILFSKSIGLLIMGRIIAGFAVGFSSGAVPVYCMEVSTPGLRGLFGTSYQVFVNIGLLVASILGKYMSYQGLSGFALGICIVGPIVLFFMPESPAYMFGQMGEDGKQRIIYAIRRLRSGDSNPEEEYEELELKASAGGAAKLCMSTAELKQPEIYKPLIVAMMMMAFQQFCGINAVIFYLVPIFKDAGAHLDPRDSAIITGLILVVATLAASVFIEKMGRKWFMLISSLGMFVSLICLGAYFNGKPTIDLTLNETSVKRMNQELAVKDYSAHHGTIALLSLFAFVITFSFGYGPVPFMMIPEMTPYVARAFVTGNAVLVSWSLAFVVTKNFQTMIDTIGAGGAFFTFAAFTGLSAVWSTIFLRETRGKSSEELESLYRH